MFEKLKRKSLRKITERHLASRDCSKVNGKVKTVGFLVDEGALQDFETLYDFHKIVALPPKDVLVFSFVLAKKKLPTLEFNQVQSKEFGWKGEISNQNANQFLEKPLDVLVGCYQDPNEFLDVMMSKSKAAFKVGFSGVDERLFDLILEVPMKEISVWKSELVKYLTILNKI